MLPEVDRVVAIALRRGFRVDYDHARRVVTIGGGRLKCRVTYSENGDVIAVATKSRRFSSRNVSGSLVNVAMNVLEDIRDPEEQ